MVDVELLVVVVVGLIVWVPVSIDVVMIISGLFHSLYRLSFLGVCAGVLTIFVEELGRL